MIQKNMQIKIDNTMQIKIDNTMQIKIDNTMQIKIDNTIEYLGNRNNRINIINFLGKFSIIGSSILTLILVADIMIRN